MNTLVLSGWKRIAAVCAVAFVSLSMLFTVAYPRQTHAATVAELQAQIQTLLAQLAQLQSGAASSCYAFTRDLTLGATGSDVTALQNYLKSTGHFPVTTASTGYFGAITRSAVAAWQAGNGVAPAAGYWGMLSRGKYNAVCKPVTPTPAPSPSDDDSDDDANDDDDEDNDLSRGEADIRNFESLNEFDNEDVDEGDEVEVFGFTFDVDDADARLERLDLVLEAQANNKNTRPWIYIDEIMVLQDGDEVASIRANRKTDWSKDSDQDNDGRDEYEIRLTKINTVVEEGTSPEFNVVVVAKDNIDSSDSGQEFLMSVDDRGARLTDGDGISHEIGDRDDTSSFTVEEAGEDVELNVRLNRDNLDAATLEIDSSSQSEPFAILSFDLEAENGEIEINELPITIGTIGTSTVTYNNFIADIWLEVDGDEYTDDSAATPNAATSTVTFDLDGDLVIDEGDTVRVDVMVEFKKQEGNYGEGLQIQAYINGTNADAIDAETFGDDLTASDINGSAIGDIHTLRTEGISLELIDKEARREQAQFSGDNDTARFTIEFTVEAFGEDVYIPFGATTTAAATTTGVVFDILGSNSTIVTSGFANGILDSSADERDGAFVVREGDSETFTLEVSYNPEITGFYQLELQQVFFRGEGEADSEAQAHLAKPDATFRTSSVNVRG